MVHALAKLQAAEEGGGRRTVEAMEEATEEPPMAEDPDAPGETGAIEAEEPEASPADGTP